MGWVNKNTQSFSNPGKTLASIDPSKAIGNTLAKIDPGPAIGKGLASVDKFVGDTIPGGWATVGVLAVAVAAPYAAPYLAQATGGAAITTAAGTEAFFAALASGASSSSAISAGISAQAALTTAALGSAAVKGATVGGALGGARAALTGEDIVKGALTGAAMGGLTGGALSGVTQALVASGLSAEVAKAAAPMLLQAGNSIAMGQDPALILQNVAMSGALSKLTGNLSDTAIKNGINSTLVGAGIGAGTGALTSGIKGGDVLGGATTGAIAGGISSGLNSLTAPAAPAPVTDKSERWTPPEGYGDELSDLSKRQFEAASKLAAENAAGYFPEFQLAKDVVEKNITETTSAFNAAKLAQKNLDDALNKPEYVEAYNKAQELLKPAQESFNAVKDAEADYLAKVEAFNADSNRTQAQLDAVNAAEKNYASLAQTYSQQYSQFDSANKELSKMYDTDIVPLQTNAQTTTAALTDTLKKYDTDYETLNKVAGKLNVSLSQLDQISKGELPSGLNIPTVAMGAPTTSGNVVVEQAPNLGGNEAPKSKEQIDEAFKQQLISDLNSGKISLSEYNKEMTDAGFQKPTTLISAGSPTTSPSGPNTALYNLLSGGSGGASLGAPNNLYTPLAFSQDGRVSSFQVPGSGEVYSVLKYNLDGTATTAPQSKPEEITTIYLDSVTGTVTPVAPATPAPVTPPKEQTEEEKKVEEEKKKAEEEKKKGPGGGGGTAGEQGDAAAADAAAKAAKDAADEAARLAQENIIRAGQDAENARIAEAKAIADADAKARAEAIIAQEQAAAAAQQAAQEAQRAREAQEQAAAQQAAQQAAQEAAAREAAAQQAAQEAAARQAAEQAAAQQAAQEAADIAQQQAAAREAAAREVENARLAEAKAIADADARARAEAMIAQEQAAAQQAAQQAAEQAAAQQAAEQAAAQQATQQATEQAAAEQAAQQQAAQQAAAQQAAQEAAAQEAARLAAEKAAADAALANQTNAGQGSTGTGNTGTVGSGSTGTTDVGTAGTDTTGTGAGTTGTGSGTGTVGEGGGTAGTGTGTGSGSGSGSGTGSGSGSGTGTGGYYGYAQQFPDIYGGIKNLTPGLTQRMDYTLTGLPNIQETINPMGDIPNMASGGATSLGGPFINNDTKGVDGSLTPGLTKAQLNYILAGMPGNSIQTKAEGGSIEGHNPTFFSEGGLGSMDNQYVEGDGDGTSDSIAAMLADGEFVIPADVVADLGNGSNEAGASILNQLLISIRQDRHPGSDGELPKDSKGPLAYLLDAKRKVKA